MRTCRQIRAFALHVVLWALCLGTRCLALPATDLLARAWPPGSDSRQQSVQALMQTRDGYIWVGTGKGLLRFDGVSFTAFTAENTPGMNGDNVSFDALWEDNTGAVWVGTYDRGLVRDDHGRFTTFGKEQGLPGDRVLRIDGDEAGAVWIFTDGGVARWQNEHLERVQPERDAALVPHLDRRTRDFDLMGLWRRSPAGIERFSYGHWRRFPTPPGEQAAFEDDVRSIYEDRLRRVWYALGSQPGNYFCVQNGQLTTFRGLPPGAFVSYQDRAGFLWLNDHTAHPARWKAGKSYPLPQLHTASLLNVLEGADGVTWAGSFHTDLVQYRPKLISTILTSGAPEEGSVLFRQRSGAVWAGGATLLRPREENNGPSLPRLAPSKEWDTIRALSEDGQGRLLIGSVHHPGGQVLDHGMLLPYLPYGFNHGTIRAMLLAPTGEQWIGTDHGLYRASGRAGNAPQLILGSASVHFLTETSQGTLWAGTTTGLLHFQEGRAVPLPGNAWPYGEVYGATENADGELWIATARRGVVRYAHGAFRAFGTADGLPTNTAYTVSFDVNGDLWIRSDVGLLRIRKQSIKHAADAAGKLQVLLLGGADGLPATDMAPPGNQGSLAPNQETLWFATTSGIASLNPADFVYTTSSPRPMLEEHAIDQSGLVSGSDIVLSPEQNNLELHYTALGSRRPEQLTFRYRLRGYDHGWTAAGTRRVAYYTQLPSGTYTFEVQAANGDDEDWGKSVATAEIRVLTPFYRTWWMKSLLCCLLVGLVVSIALARRSRAMERDRLRQAFTHRLIATQEGERKRIAHELHDSLGHHLALIRTLAILSKPSVQSSRADHLDRIVDQAAIAIQEVEDISYDLRPYQLDRLGLTKAILSLIRAFRSSSSVRLTHTIENIDGLIPKDMEIIVYRIVQEALGNVLKHAEASEATVTIAQTEAALSLVVSDNGRGFVTSAGSANREGLGLIGIKERAEALGGHAVIGPAETAGTRVTVTLPRTK